MGEKISQLTDAGSLTGSELIETVQNGNSRKTTTQDIANLGGASYYVYTALLSQSGSDAPVATVLRNTLGFVPEYFKDAGNGGYYISGGFTEGKTIYFFQAPGSWLSSIQIVEAEHILNEVGYPPNMIYFSTKTDLSTAADNWGVSIPVRIEVYP